MLILLPRTYQVTQAEHHHSHFITMPNIRIPSFGHHSEGKERGREGQRQTGEHLLSSSISQTRIMRKAAITGHILKALQSKTHYKSPTTRAPPQHWSRRDGRDGRRRKGRKAGGRAVAGPSPDRAGDPSRAGRSGLFLLITRGKNRAIWYN